MRRLVKRLLKKHKYPPEGMDDAVQTVMSQCEMWTDNVMEAESRKRDNLHHSFSEKQMSMVAEKAPDYGSKT